MQDVVSVWLLGSVPKRLHWKKTKQSKLVLLIICFSTAGCVTNLSLYILSLCLLHIWCDLLTHFIWNISRRELGWCDHCILPRDLQGCLDVDLQRERGRPGDRPVWTAVPCFDRHTQLPFTLWRSLSLQTFTHAACISGVKFGHDCTMKGSNA